jgi:hypothetical protein
MTMTDPDDRKDQICTECGVGRYQETSIHDDWDGVLHCTNKECNYEVKRYKSDDNPQPKPEKVKLSPAAQAVLDAANYVYDRAGTTGHGLAAALRAAADQVEPDDGIPAEVQRVLEKLLAIAKELEGA